jgi:hypothetical protein
VENFQNKEPNLGWYRAQVSEALCRQVSFEIEKFREFEKSQPGEFWDSHL